MVVSILKFIVLFKKEFPKEFKLKNYVSKKIEVSIIQVQIWDCDVS